MEHNHHIKILYGLVVLLLVAMVGMASVWSQSGKGSQSGLTPSTVPPSAPASDLTGVVVGGANLPLAIAGTITAIGSGSMKIKSSDQGTMDSVVLNTNTQFETLGPTKDATTMQNEYTAYNAQIAELMKDPQKNKAALATLHPPVPQTFLPATLTDFAVGDQVQVNASSTDATGAYVATLVLKIAAQ